jgi:hypothetical protein
VKEKIAAEKGWEASQQKLIYSGPYPLVAFPIHSCEDLDVGVDIVVLSRQNPG